MSGESTRDPKALRFAVSMLIGRDIASANDGTPSWHVHMDEIIKLDGAGVWMVLDKFYLEKSETARRLKELGMIVIPITRTVCVPEELRDGEEGETARVNAALSRASATARMERR